MAIYSLDVLLSQFWTTPLVPCLVLNAVFWPAYRFLRRQVRWSGIPISKNFLQSVVVNTVKGFNIVSEAEVDVFLEFSWFFYNSVDVGNLISGSSAFSKVNLYIWKFSVHILLKPSLKDFEHYLASMWNECSCTVVGAFSVIALLWDWKMQSFLQRRNNVLLEVSRKQNQ